MLGMCDKPKESSRKEIRREYLNQAVNGQACVVCEFMMNLLDKNINKNSTELTSRELKTLDIEKP